MPDYPPKGKERKVLKTLVPIERAIRELERQFEIIPFASDTHSLHRRDNLSWGITLSHALEGVRCNGCEDTNTLADIILGSRRILAVLPERRDKVIECFDNLEKALLQILEMCNVFVICPDCKGEKGEKVSLGNRPGYVSYASKWKDCSTCDGRGVLEI